MKLPWSAAAAAAVLSGVLCAAPAASAVVVADYQSDFVVTNDPAARNGWSYLWNANGPVGNPANYVPLAVRGGQYVAPGTPIVAGSRPVGVDERTAYPDDPFFGPYPDTFVRPGFGIADPGSGGIERAIVLAYTFGADDIAAAGGGNAFMTGYDFAVAAVPPTVPADGISVRVYEDNNPNPLRLDPVPPFPFPPGYRIETRLDRTPRPLGNYSAGETVYIVIGSNATSLGDEMRFDFTISLVPEPGTMALLLPVCALLMRRRGSR